MNKPIHEKRNEALSHGGSDSIDENNYISTIKIINQREKYIDDNRNRILDSYNWETFDEDTDY